MEVVKLTEREFKSTVRASRLAVIDCYAKWCGPCKIESQIMKSAAENIENVDFYKIDIDEADEVVIEYQITSIPTLLFIRDGKVIKKKVGLTTEEDIARIISSL